MKRTVDGNGNGLVEGEAILASEGGDLAERRSLEVLSRTGAGKVNLLNLEVETVGLSNSLDGSAAGVALRKENWSAKGQLSAGIERFKAYSVGEESSESHLF